MSTHPHALVSDDLFLEDKELQQWITSADGHDFVNSFIWDNLLIGPRTIRYKHRDVDLLTYFQKSLDELQDQFEGYQELYRYNMIAAAASANGTVFDKAKAAMDYPNSHPFKFKPFYGIHLSTRKINSPFCFQKEKEHRNRNANSL